MNAQLALPLARTTDPDTSRAAAASMKSANSEIIDYIRHVVEHGGPLTHEQIAHDVNLLVPGRWERGSIVSACARAHLSRHGTRVVTRRNGSKRPLALWVLGPLVEDVEPKTEVL